MSTLLLKMEGLERHYHMPSGTVKALDGIDFEINDGERIILLGPSGSGKSTLLNCLSALDTPTSGTYDFAGKSVPRSPKYVSGWWNLSSFPKNRTALNIFVNILRPLTKVLFFPIEYFSNSRPMAKASEKATSFRRENIGYVFQFFNLLQDLTVLENILLIQELADSRDVKRAILLLRLVGLENVMHRFPAEISGGQQQRVAIARSLAKKPRLLLGDELTGNLDSKTSEKVMTVLVKACESEGITCVFVTHDESLTKYATRVVRIDSGKIISDEKVM